MALAKYAEEIRETIEERMAMREQMVSQDYKPQYSAIKTATAQNMQESQGDNR